MASNLEQGGAGNRRKNRTPRLAWLVGAETQGSTRLAPPERLRNRSCPRSLTRPRFGDVPPPGKIIDDQNQLIVVVTVEHLDVHARVRHAPREHAELTRDSLYQAQCDHFLRGEHTNADRLERFAGGVAIFEEEMRNAGVANSPGSPAFDADS